MSWLFESCFGRSHRRETSYYIGEKFPDIFGPAPAFSQQSKNPRRHRSTRRQPTFASTNSASQPIHEPPLPVDRHSPTNSSDHSGTVYSNRHEHNKYSYAPLDNNVRQIRLFVLEQSPINTPITGRLRHWSLDDHPEYEALSYTWGNLRYMTDAQQSTGEDSGDIEIRLDGLAFLVAKNLHNALLCLRRADGPRCFWIDAICINQNDVEERNQQVTLMQHIYTEAISVVAWLGSPDRPSSIFMDILEEVTLTDHRPYRHRTVKRALQSREYNFRAIYRKFFQRSYWYRTWIIQEIYFGGQITLQCGHKFANWRTLREFQTFLTEECETMNSDHPWAALISRDDLKTVLSHAERFSALDTLQRSRPRGRRNRRQRIHHLAQLLFDNWSAQATDARDKIYALMNIATDSQYYNIDVDYRLPVRDVYINFVREHIRLSRNISIILPRRAQDPANDLPSWCVDLSSTVSSSGSALRDTYPFLTLKSPYHASTMNESGRENEFFVNFSPCGRIMMAQGWRLGTVRDLSDATGTRGYQERKEKIIDFSCISPLFGLVRSQSPPEPWEVEVWYSIYRHILHRGFRAEVKRNLVNNSRRDYRDYCQRKHNEFFQTRLRATSHEVDGFNDIKAPIEWRRHCDTPRTFEQLPNENLNASLCRVMRRLGQSNVHTGHKNFFVTDTGLMGLAPNGARRSDIVCILRGCPLPILLRLDDQHTRLIGCCYVAGFMHGEVHTYIQNSRIPVLEETFSIC